MKLMYSIVFNGILVSKSPDEICRVLRDFPASMSVSLTPLEGILNILRMEGGQRQIVEIGLEILVVPLLPDSFQFINFNRSQR